MVEIKITGIDKVLQGISNIGNNISNPRQPLNNSATYMQQEALRNFAEGGAVMQEGGWKPLSKVTLEIKEREGYGSSPMMVREGLLRSSFEKSEPIISQDISYIKVYNPIEYAKFHQTGYGVPQRVLLKLMSGHILKITDIFKNWIVGNIQKSFSE